MKLPFARTLDLSVGGSLLAAVIWFVIGFPIFPVWLAIGFALYAVCLWRRPLTWLVIVPALLPIFDLAPWSGRIFFDEFDALVLLTAGTLLLRERFPQPIAASPPILNRILVLLALSYLCSIVIRIWPLPSITPNSFASYYSPYNSLRVAKGFVWALLLYRPFRQAIASEPNAKILLCTGFVAGLAGVAAVALYERWMFPGLWALYTDYRISASFSSMHTGDGPIDVWLAATIPMLAVLLQYGRRWLPIATGLLIAGLYTLFATQSRGPVIALGLALVAGMGALCVSRTTALRAIGIVILSSVTLGLVAAVSVPVFAQTSFGQRFEQIGPDASSRLQHWRNALSLRDDTMTARILGMGLGSYPLFHHLRSTAEPRSASYVYSSDTSGRFVRFWSGQNLYFGQAIGIVPHSAYNLTMKVRTSEENASLNVLWCEVWVMTSEACAATGFRLQPGADRWTTLTATINSGATGLAKSLPGMTMRRPSRLAFFVSNATGGGVDIGAVSVKDARNRELVQNEAFRDGVDHWFWTVDTDLPWHLDDLYAGILFEQGWLGIFAMGSLLFLSCTALARRLARGDPLSVIFTASIIGFIVTGISVSTFDQPRLTLMFYLLSFAIICGSQRPLIIVPLKNRQPVRGAKR